MKIENEFGLTHVTVDPINTQFGDFVKLFIGGSGKSAAGVLLTSDQAKAIAAQLVIQSKKNGT